MQLVRAAVEVFVLTDVRVHADMLDNFLQRVTKRLITTLEGSHSGRIAVHVKNVWWVDLMTIFFSFGECLCTTVLYRAIDVTLLVMYWPPYENVIFFLQQFESKLENLNLVKRLCLV